MLRGPEVPHNLQRLGAFLGICEFFGKFVKENEILFLKNFLVIQESSLVRRLHHDGVAAEIPVQVLFRICFSGVGVFQEAGGLQAFGGGAKAMSPLRKLDGRAEEA